MQKFIGIYREDSSGLMGIFYVVVMNVVFVSGMMGVLVLGSFVYICKHLMDMATSTNAMIIMMAGIGGVACYCGIASNLKSTRKLYDLLQQLADESFKHRGFTGFRDAEDKSHFLILVAFLMSLWNIYQDNYDTSNWFLPFRIILPIDNSNLIGWYLELFLQAYGGYVYVLSVTTIVAFFGGCSYYIDAEEIDEVIEKDIFETVVFHNKILELFDIVADIYSAAIFFHLICNILFLAGAVYQTEMTIGKVGLDLLFNVLCVMEALSYTFILCYFANSSTYSMAEIGNVVYYSSWYNQPPKIQKLLLLIIARAQKPNIFMGLKIIYCHLESFAKVCFQSPVELHSKRIIKLSF
ncbi:odorant receptor 45b-like [Sitodiplosis mosellana]|uniref:odorant receptor 45b-like n=1 Tax=Sitodiplosis mosellana TaxID=263140 RepID=UPI002444F4B8|nr:odorant receptor 45b-like [Sitodiplosis mosellana]